MIRNLLIGMIIVMSVSCFRSGSDEDLFRLVWDGKVPKTLKINRVIGDKDAAFAVFAELSKSEFDDFRKKTSRFRKWNSLDEGISFEIGSNELRSPNDVRGIYSLGGSVNGLIRVIVWDDKSEIVVAMQSSGVM